MKRLAIVLASIAILTVGLAATAFAQTPPTPQSTGGCGGGAGVSGNYDPANNPTLKRLADKIGVGVQDLVSELKADKSVVDVAKTKNVDEQALVDLLQAPRAEMMAVMVKYGYLTKEQVDSTLKSMADSTKSALEQKGLSNGFGIMGGGMMGAGTSGMMSGGVGGMMGGGSGLGGMMSGLRQN